MRKSAGWGGISAGSNSGWRADLSKRVSLLSGDAIVGQSCSLLAKAASLSTTQLGASWPDHRETNSTPPRRRLLWPEVASPKAQNTRNGIRIFPKVLLQSNWDKLLPAPFPEMFWVPGVFDPARGPGLCLLRLHLMCLVIISCQLWAMALTLQSLLSSGQSPLRSEVLFRVERTIQHRTSCQVAF